MGWCWSKVVASGGLAVEPCVLREQVECHLAGFSFARDPDKTRPGARNSVDQNEEGLLHFRGRLDCSWSKEQRDRQATAIPLGRRVTKVLGDGF